MPRILLVEDSPTQAMSVRTRLEDESYEVALAENGHIAMNMIPTFEPDLIVTDLEMPVMNGLELVTASITQYAAVPVILITAQGSDKLAMEALERGAAAYLPKSLLKERLLSTIDQVLGVKKADRSYADLISSMAYNEFRFVLENNVDLISPLVDLIQRMASGIALCNDVDRVRIGMALEHALRNALFHGNLEYSRDEFDDASEFEVAGESSQIDDRRAQAPYCDRKIRVTVKLTPDEATFIVCDDGVGFDTSTLPAAHDPRLLDQGDGRGLVLILSFMDEVSFNASGNEITMIKRRRT